MQFGRSAGRVTMVPVPLLVTLPPAAYTREGGTVAPVKINDPRPKGGVLQEARHLPVAGAQDVRLATRATDAASGGECDPKRFKSAAQAQRFLSAHDQINNLFHLRRDHITATQYRVARAQSFAIWAEVMGSRAMA
jgi:hypothetical protein